MEYGTASYPSGNTVRFSVAIDEAHRGVSGWVWGRLGYVTMSLVGESGALLEVLLELIFGKPSQKKNANVVVVESNSDDAPSESMKKRGWTHRNHIFHQYHRRIQQQRNNNIGSSSPDTRYETPYVEASPFKTLSSSTTTAA